MDLAAFGCRAVVLKPPPDQHKPSLSPRGWVGTFLGRGMRSELARCDAKLAADATEAMSGGSALAST